MASRSPKVVVSIFVFLALFLPVNLSAQVFPKTEYLDVITLSDGTILKGIVTESVPDRYVQIELYGGSSFVLGFGEIESIEKLVNPDYAPTWIKVDLAEQQPPEDEADSGDATPGAAPGPGDTRSLREGGLTFGAYLGLGAGWYDGPDWDTDLPSEPDNLVQQLDGFGIFFRATGQPTLLENTMWMWGLRGGFGKSLRDGGFYADDPFGIGDLEYQEFTDTIYLPLEFLFGGTGDRFALYGGMGPGFSVLIKGPQYEINFKGTDEFDDSGTYETDTVASLIVTTSLNAIARLGRNWEADFRVAYERLLFPWDSDRKVYHNAVDFTLGLGYRF